mmetsp:Transcript_17406/g.39331  ORF Transcript_17406/g.39331 Transcript_17406/m.39331 type:complete len:211 (+) Transcript_17406:1-633(+)
MSLCNCKNIVILTRSLFIQNPYIHPSTPATSTHSRYSTEVPQHCSIGSNRSTTSRTSPASAPWTDRARPSSRAWRAPSPPPSWLGWTAGASCSAPCSPGPGSCSPCRSSSAPPPPAASARCSSWSPRFCPELYRLRTGCAGWTGLLLAAAAPGHEISSSSAGARSRAGRTAAAAAVVGTAAAAGTPAAAAVGTAGNWPPAEGWGQVCMRN